MIARRILWAGALGLLALLHAAWQISAVPLSLKIGIAGLTALSIASPALGLLVWAGLAPLTSSIVGIAGVPVLGAQLLEMMTLAVIAGAVARHRWGTPTRLGLPALAMATVALASGLSEVPARLIAATQTHTGVAALAWMLVEHAVDRIAPLEPWYFGLIVAQGAAFAWVAESIVRREPEAGPRVVWCALLGHAGVAVLNLTRVVGASLRTGEFPASLPGTFFTIREHTQYDVNAAASIFVLVILAGFGLASRRARTPLLLAIGAVTLALWVAGSRVAMAALAVTLAAVFVMRGRRSARTLWITGSALLATAAVIAWLGLGYPAGRNLSLSKTVASRLVLFKAAIRMTASSPVLGVGAGTFLEESPNFGATDLAPLVYDGRTRDNAHNYFLQTAAEQGLVGLAALLAMLGAALWPAVRPSVRRDTLTTWLAAGVIASVLTWLTGHPLLVTEAALMFWLFIGLTAGLTEAPTPRPAIRRLVLVAVVALLASVPFRAMGGERAADLEHFATGVSVWQPALDGERYRAAGSEFSLFLPSGTLMVLPLRSAGPSDVTLELRLDTRPFDAIVAPAGSWRSARVQVPESASRYVKIDFRVTDPPGPCDACVWVGKAGPLAPK